MGILLGIASAVFWGVGDFLITLLTRRIGTTRALIAIQALSLLSWLVLLALWRSEWVFEPKLMLLMLATAVCHVLGLIFVYRAFEIGTLSIVGPISAGFAAVNAVLALVSGERPPFLTLSGTAVLIGGAVLATRSGGAPAERAAAWRGVPEAILSAVAFGTMFWMFYFFVEPKLGYSWPMVALKSLAVLSSIGLYMARGKRESTAAMGSRSGVFVLALAAAAADTLAWLAYIRGMDTTFAIVVTALASLFSVVTVLLAWRFFRERLSGQQWVGVAAILVGILVVSIEIE